LRELADPIDVEKELGDIARKFTVERIVASCRRLRRWDHC
jgi:hypothetical protein